MAPSTSLIRRISTSALIASLLAAVLVLNPNATLTASAAATFTDVPESHPFFDEIEWLVAEGITTGFPDGTFRPGASVTRQAFAAFIHRYEAPVGFTPPATPTFSDVPTTHPFFVEIEWLASTGITTGFDDGTFRPGATITRQAIGAFFFRYNDPAAWTPPAIPSFTDVPLAHTFFSEIEWLASTGITTGFEDGTFRPGAEVTRQATAAFFFRYDEALGETVPAAPTDVVAVAGDTQATVSWTAPAADGGSPITGYRVTVSPGGATVEIVAPTTEAVATGLTNGVAYTFTVAAENAVGFGPESQPSNSVTPENEALEIPPDPATVAPEINGTVEPTLYSMTRFLWAGTPKIQYGVAADTIVPDEAAAVRGRVLDVDGAALPGVEITVLDHPEYGTTVSRADGGFDLVVNADRHHLIVFEKPGHPSVQRLARVVADEWTDLEDIVMTPFDTKATEIETGAAEVQVHEATTTSDVDGDRTATLLFPAGTEADLVMPDGSREALATMTVRATEYTVGARGPAAMPGDLPVNSAYTYAVELSVDEANDAGARTVEFDQPVLNYTDNFIGFPAGSRVPTATYDTDLGSWVADKDGWVIDVVGETGDLADLDVDGDGTADTGTALTDLGITDAEREALAGLYAPGASLWRVEVSHFSPKDHNWPAGCDALPCVAPPPYDGQPERPLSDKCTKNGSIVSCQEQSVGEQVGVTGTPYALNYWSDRTTARASGRGLEIRLTDDAPPEDLLRVDLTISVAGQVHRESFAPAPDLVTEFLWDGVDAYGRTVPASTFAQVRVDFVYSSSFALVYNASGSSFSFGSPSTGGATSFNRELSEFASGRLYSVLLDNRDARDLGVGGWTFDTNHRLDAKAGQLLQGDGTTREVGEFIDMYVMEPIAGTGDPCESGPCGDGGPGAAAQVAPFAMAVGPDDLLYFYDGGTNSIRRVESDSSVDTVWGGPVCADHPATDCGTGGPATGLSFVSGVTAMAFGPDGTLYFNDSAPAIVEGETVISGGGAVIRAITPAGQVEHIAGDGEICYPNTYPDCGDNGPAPQASFQDVDDIAVTPDGVVHLLAGPAIRKVQHGWITHEFGCHTSDCEPEVYGNGVPAAFVAMSPDELEVGPDGSLIYSDFGDANSDDPTAVRRIDPVSGDVVTLAGTSAFHFCQDAVGCRDNWPAVDAEFATLSTMAVDRDGFVHTFDVWDNVAFVDRRFYPGGKIYRVAGNVVGPCQQPYDPGDCGDHGPARDANLGQVTEVTAGPDGIVYFFDFEAGAIRAMVPRDEVILPSLDGDQAFVFDQEGRHLRTHDTTTGATLYEFAYDAEGRLVSITDRDGNETTIQRDASGDPTSITGPFGQVTELSTHPDGRLASIANPAGDTHSMTYGEAGLLATFTDPVGNTSTFTYDGSGRLIKDENDAGGSLTLSRTAIDIPGTVGYEVTVTTEEGRATVYRVSASLLTPTLSRTVTEPTGAVSAMFVDDTGDNTEVTTSFPDGRTFEILYQDDPRWGEGNRVVASVKETAPGLPVSTSTFDRTVEHPPDELLAPTAITETVVRNGRTTTYAYDGATRTETWTTPEGDVRTHVLDEKGRAISVDDGPGVAPESALYDDRGLTTSLTIGDRTTSYGYDARGRLITLTDAEGNESSFEYDAADRRVVTESADGHRWTTVYDGNGNAVSATMPAGQNNTFTYNPVERPTGWTAPGPETESRTYSADQNMTQRTLADGSTVTRTYDAGGRPTGETFAEASTTLSYVGQTNRIAQTEWDPPGPTNQRINLSYRGIWVISADMVGPAAGNFDFTYDADRRITEVQIDSTTDDHTFPVAYDNDRNRTGYGPFTLDRSGPGDQPAAISDGTGTTSLTYNPHLEVTGRTLEAGGVTAQDLDLVRDDLGRVTERTEVTAAGTEVTDYTYDADGQLTSYSVGGSSAASYEYDVNGNPVEGPTGTAVFDSNDRVTSVEGVPYTYDAAGFLTGRGDDTFNYTTTGGLLTATVDGETIDYTYDGFGRRTTRTDDEGETSYLYGSPINPFQITAARYPDGSFDVYFYDDAGAMYALMREGVMHYVGTDQVGSPVIVVDATGTVVKQVSYDPWGNVLTDSAPGLPLALGFAGGLPDGDTGLVRFGMRDYDPRSGRWTASDPARFQGGPNLYSYVANNPANLVDPTGLVAMCFGGSVYAGWGGGGQICSGPDGVSICTEVGAGVGGGFTAGLGEVQDTSVAAGAEISAECAGGGGSLSGELVLDECGPKGDVCGGASFVGAGGKVCSNGTPELTMGVPPDVLSCGAGAKGYIKGCLEL